MRGSTVVNNNGVGVGSLLLLLFIGLKLTGYIAWSWWWVMAPLWMPLALVLIIGGIASTIFIKNSKVT